MEILIIIILHRRRPRYDSAIPIRKVNIWGKVYDSFSGNSPKCHTGWKEMKVEFFEWWIVWKTEEEIWLSFFFQQKIG